MCRGIAKVSEPKYRIGCCPEAGGNAQATGISHRAMRVAEEVSAHAGHALGHKAWSCLSHNATDRDLASGAGGTRAPPPTTNRHSPQKIVIALTLSVSSRRQYISHIPALSKSPAESSHLGELQSLCVHALTSLPRKVRLVRGVLGRSGLV